MEKYFGRHAGKYMQFALYILGVIFVVLCILLVKDYFYVRRETDVAAREGVLSSFVNKHGPLTADEVGVIRPWMTFDYINRLFGLPASYLQQQLTITDKYYPRLTVGTYASRDDLDTQTFILQLESTVQNYFKNGSST